MAEKDSTLAFELDTETVRAIGRHFDRRAAEREAETVIGRAIAEREKKEKKCIGKPKICAIVADALQDLVVGPDTISILGLPVNHRNQGH